MAKKEPKKDMGAKIVMDDAFCPNEITFTEAETTIQFFRDGDSVRIQTYKKNDFQYGMRVPLYACAAFAQFFSQTLNGKKLLI